MEEYLTRYMIAEPSNQTEETVMKTFIDVTLKSVQERQLTEQWTYFLSQIMDTLYQQLVIEK